MLNAGSSPTLNKVTFSNNFASEGGGAMFNSIIPTPPTGYIGTTATITNTVLSNNSAIDGGGILNFFSSAVITNATFYGNYAVEHGGGVNNPDGGEAIIKNSIFWNNTAVDGGSNIYNSYTLKIGYSDVQGGFDSIYGDILALDGTTLNSGNFSSASFNINSDPFISSIVPVDLRLKDGSLATDAGTTLFGGAPSDDILGNPRTGIPDMGAYESTFPPCIPGQDPRCTP